MRTMFCQTCDSKVSYAIVDSRKVCNCCGDNSQSFKARVSAKVKARESLIARLLAE